MDEQLLVGLLMVDMMVMVNADVSVTAKMRWMVGGLSIVDMMMMMLPQT